MQTEVIDTSRVEEFIQKDSLDSFYIACCFLFKLMTYEQFVKCAIFVIEKEMEIYKDYPKALNTFRETIEDVKVNRLRKCCAGDYRICDDKTMFISWQIEMFGTNAGSKAINGEKLVWENYETFKLASDIAEKKIWLELLNYGLSILKGNN